MVKKEKLVKKEKFVRHKRRVLSSLDYCVPEQSLSVRTLIDRVSKGLPVNAQLSKHIPLPPDGVDLEDFDTGMEELTDVTDVVEHTDKIQAELKYIQEQKQKALDEASGKVNTEVPPAES